VLRERNRRRKINIARIIAIPARFTHDIELCPHARDVQVRFDKKQIPRAPAQRTRFFDPRDGIARKRGCLGRKGPRDDTRSIRSI